MSVPTRLKRMAHNLRIGAMNLVATRKLLTESAAELEQIAQELENPTTLPQTTIGSAYSSQVVIGKGNHP